VARSSASPRRAPSAAGRPVNPTPCLVCTGDIAGVDYKGVTVLRRFVSDRGRLRARRVSGTCARHQRDVGVAVKTARELALLPYAERTEERSGGRGRARGRGHDHAAVGEQPEPRADGAPRQSGQMEEA
jgi:small subunit ribosomal protein S18